MLILAALWASNVANAQTADDQLLSNRVSKRLDQLEKNIKELRAIVYQGRETGQPVVVEPADTDSRLNSQGERLDDLDRSLSRLNGEIDVLRHDLDEIRSQSSELVAANADLKARVTNLEQQKVASAPAAPPPPLTEPAAAEPSPEDAFATARRALLAGDTAGAEADFRGFLDHYGDAPQAPEAHYYLGRVLLSRGAYADAATAEIRAIRGWPQTAWAPRAVLDLSRALHGMGKDADACQTVAELTRRYPQSPRDVRTGAASVRSQARCA
ncbi:MAG TPA: tetratricopeptide repeat protein [Caulobacteraceae bacterium]|nr:tetratricopeptide repeat protein [Caulobacteraceae bacterium]